MVLISTELDEVLGLADRIAVMYRGKIAGEVPARDTRRAAGPADGRLVGGGGAAEATRLSEAAAGGESGGLL